MKHVLLAVALLLAPALPAVAQDDVGTRIEAQVFPPELVMKHAREIDLTADQRRQITAAIGEAQGQLIDLQWQLGEAATAVAQALEPARADEADVLQKLDRVLDLERQIKRRQMVLVIRIRNLITPQQQARLKELRARS
jgi:Spy/CpxP family protein refolding chaperone